MSEEVTEDVPKQLRQKLEEQPPQDRLLKLSEIHTYNLDNTKTSKLADKLEKRLSKKLLTLVERLRLEPMFDSIVVEKYNILVKEVIREGVEQSYKLAMDFVGDYYQVPVFMTDVDLKTIRERTEEFLGQFWIRYQKYVAHRNDVLEQKNNYVPRSPLSNEFIITILPVSIVTSTLNIATVLKINQIEHRNNAAPETNLFRNAQFIGFQARILMVWVCRRDEVTCGYCRAMNARAYDFDRSDMPVPGLDSHPYCRCRLIPVSMEEDDLSFKKRVSEEELL